MKNFNGVIRIKESIILKGHGLPNLHPFDSRCRFTISPDPFTDRGKKGVYYISQIESEYTKASKWTGIYTISSLTLRNLWSAGLIEIIEIISKDEKL